MERKVSLQRMLRKIWYYLKLIGKNLWDSWYIRSRYLLRIHRKQHGNL
jgi:hypothetical protein